VRDTELDALVVRHRETARRVARKFAPRLPVGCTVDDLESHLWAECWKAVRDTGGGRDLSGELDAYVFAAAVNKARNFCRQNRNRGVRYVPRNGALRVVNERHEADEGLALADLAVAPEATEEVRVRWPFERWQAILSRLTPRARKVVLLRVFNGLSHSAVAAALGVGKSLVEREWSYALAALRVLLPELETELTSA
jgi:RNA polymerase sigma factor (sigma-70 family)